MAASAAVRQAAPDFYAEAREKLIVALDFSTVEEARALVAKLGETVTFYKVGLGLQLAGVDQFLRELKAANKRIFLDYKYLDIEQTVRSAVAGAARIGIDFLTVHGVSKILKAAVEGKGNSGIKIFCVTVLTSMDAEDLREMGYTCDVEQLVLFRARKALDDGCDGVIASSLEAKKIKEITGNALMVVTPGIRLEGDSPDDQKRVGTPGDAIRAGADYLVVGRSITAHSDAVERAEKIIEEIADAMRC